MDNLNNTNYKSREEKRKYEEELIKRKSQTEKEMAKNRAEIQKILFNDENERKNKKEVKKTKTYNSPQTRTSWRSKNNKR